MKFWPIVLGVLLALSAALPAGAQSAPPMSMPRPMPPAPAGAMPDRAMPLPLRPSAPMATPPTVSPPSELTPPSEREPVATDSSRSSNEPDPVRPGSR